MTEIPAFVPPTAIPPIGITVFKPNTNYVATEVARPDSMLNLIALAASDPQTDVGKLQALMDMQRQIVAEEARLQFNRAMALAQSEMLPVTRDAMNDHTRSKYARLETIDAKIRPIYTKHGFAMSFNSEPLPNGLKITCEVTHSAGHAKSYQIEGGLDGSGVQGKANKTPIQALGSTASYLRRYLSLLVFNLTLTNEDDDGQAARVPVRSDEDRLNALEDTLAPPKDDPMVKWVTMTEKAFAKCPSTQAYFKLIDGITANVTWMRENAPELHARVEAAVKVAKTRLFPASQDAAP